MPTTEELIKNYQDCQNNQKQEGADYILDCIIQDDIERIKNGEHPVIRIYPRNPNRKLSRKGFFRRN